MGLLEEYHEFLANKVELADYDGITIDPAEINPFLKPHQVDMVVWAARLGRGLVAASFGLGKTVVQIELARLIHQLLPYIKNGWTIWEPASGEGLMARALGDAGFYVIMGDILTNQNFFSYDPFVKDDPNLDYASTFKFCHLPSHTDYFLTGDQYIPKAARAWHCAICHAGPGQPEIKTVQEILSLIQETSF